MGPGKVRTIVPGKPRRSVAFRQIFDFFPPSTGAPYPGFPVVRGALSTEPRGTGALFLDVVCHTYSAEIWCLGSTFFEVRNNAGSPAGLLCLAMAHMESCGYMSPYSVWGTM